MADDWTFRDILRNTGDYALPDYIDGPEHPDEPEPDEWDEEDEDEDPRQYCLFGCGTLSAADARKTADGLIGDFPLPPRISYPDYLKTVRWYLIRQLAYALYGDHCQNCGSQESVNVHHRTYEHVFEEAHHLDELAVLCEHCHGKHHRGEIDIERILRSINDR